MLRHLIITPPSDLLFLGGGGGNFETCGSSL